MKAICRVLRSPDSASAVLRYCLRQRGSDDDASRAEVACWEGHVDAGVLTGDAKIDAEAFTSRCPEGKRAVGHAVISAEGDEAGVEKKLLRSSHAWSRRFAEGRGYVIICHKKDEDCAHPHAHIIFERYGPGGTAVHFSRQDLREMVGMRFTDQFQPVRADGSPSPHKGAAQVYPHAKKLAAREVAELLLWGETWSSLLAKKVITPARVKDGEVLSFIYKEKRLRVATVEKLVAGGRKRLAAAAEALVTKAKVVALAQSARGMMKIGIGEMVDVVDEIAAAEPTAPALRGRSR